MWRHALHQVGRPRRARISPASLPLHHEADLAHLSAITRDQLGSYWASRARSEREVGVAFAHLRSALDRRASPAVLDLLERGSEDEERHAVICEELASRYAGGPVVCGALRPLVLPLHDGTPADLHPTLHLVALCAINETLATVWLRAALQGSRTRLARVANRLHLREELDHARAGWAHLASPFLGEGERAALRQWLPAMLRAGVASFWEEDEILGPPGHPDEGVPGLHASREAVALAARSVILPGFEHVGVSTAEASRWFDQLCQPLGAILPQTISR